MAMPLSKDALVSLRGISKHFGEGETRIHTASHTKAIPRDHA